MELSEMSEDFCETVFDIIGDKDFEDILKEIPETVSIVINDKDYSNEVLTTISKELESNIDCSLLEKEGEDRDYMFLILTFVSSMRKVLNTLN